MQKLKPINLENDVILIHPFRPIDMVRMENIASEIFEILSDTENTEFIPEKRLKEQKAASDRLFGFVLGYETGLSYALLISDKRNNKVIGIIDIISPERAKQSYTLDKYDWMIEYFLHKDYWGQGIMSGIVSAIYQKLNSQGILTIAAVCDRNNKSSISILEKIGFQKTKAFDFKQDYYVL